MSLSDKIGNIGNAEYFHPCNGEEPYNEYDEVVEVKHLREAVRELKEKINELDNRGKMHIWTCAAVIEKIDEIFGKDLK